MKGIGQNNHNLLMLLGLLAMLAVAAGCGGDSPDPETDPEAAMEGSADAMETETVPEPVEPEQPMEPEAAPDYTMMQPAEFGIEDVFFAFDQYDLDDIAMASLSRNARILKEHPEVIILLEGHTDERGTVEYNLALGERRAKAVRDYLVSLGVASSRLRVTSYGESRPFALGSNETAWAKNRRAHFARP